MQIWILVSEKKKFIFINQLFKFKITSDKQKHLWILYGVNQHSNISLGVPSLEALSLSLAGSYWNRSNNVSSEPWGRFLRTYPHLPQAHDQNSPWAYDSCARCHNIYGYFNFFLFTWWSWKALGYSNPQVPRVNGSRNFASI